MLGSLPLLTTPYCPSTPRSHAPSDSLFSSVACLILVLVSPHLSLFLSVPVLVSVCPCPGLSRLSLSWSYPVSVLVLASALGSRLSGRLGRSESLRVSDRRRPSRGSLGAKGRGGGRSRSDVDMDPSSATAVLGPARRATYVSPLPHNH